MTKRNQKSPAPLRCAKDFFSLSFRNTSPRKRKSIEAYTITVKKKENLNKQYSSKSQASYPLLRGKIHLMNYLIEFNKAVYS